MRRGLDRRGKEVSGVVFVIVNSPLGLLAERFRRVTAFQIPVDNLHRLAEIVVVNHGFVTGHFPIHGCPRRFETAHVMHPEVQGRSPRGISLEDFPRIRDEEFGVRE